MKWALAVVQPLCPSCGSWLPGATEHHRSTERHIVTCAVCGEDCLAVFRVRQTEPVEPKDTP